LRREGILVPVEANLISAMRRSYVMKSQYDAHNGASPRTDQPMIELF